MSATLRVLVTGGAGFIGSHLVERLIGMGCLVRVLDNLSKGSIDNLAHARGAELVIGDILDHDAVSRAVKDIDVVFHLAALTSVAESMSDPARYHDVCGNGTKAVLRLASFAGVRRFVYAASSSCYGDAGESPIPESATLAPQSPYAEAKIAGESDCVDASNTGIIETVRLRFFNVYGPRQDPRGSYAGVICAFVDAIQNDRPLTIYGDGEQTRDFVHVTDVARALASAGLQPGINGRVFNIGTGTRTSLRALALAVGDAAGQEVIPVHAAGRDGDVRHSCADVTAARESLGFSASVDLAGGLGDLLHVGHRQAA